MAIAYNHPSAAEQWAPQVFFDKERIMFGIGIWEMIIVGIIGLMMIGGIVAAIIIAMSAGRRER